MSLRLRVLDTRTDTSETAVFRTSPVRIGRNALNELMLDQPYVSQWHGVIHFDADGAVFKDIGSTNGTLHGGRRLSPSEEVRLGAGVAVHIGPLQVEALAPGSWALPTSIPPERSAAADGGTSTAGASGPVGPHAEMAGAKPDSVSGEPHAVIGASLLMHQAAGEPQTGIGRALRAERESTVNVNGATPATDDATLTDDATRLANPAIDALAHLRAVLSIVEPLRERYLGEVRDQLATIPEGMRGEIQDQLSRTFSELGESELRDPRKQQVEFSNDSAPEPRPARASAATLTNAGAASSGAAREGAVGAWLGHLVDGNMKTPPATDAQALARVAAVLQTFTHAFVALQQGHERFGCDLGMELHRQSNLPTEGGPDVLLAHFFDFSADGEERILELTRAFADLAVHQVAFLNAVTEGARALLERLAPEAQEKGTDGEDSRPSPLAKFGRWGRYVATHRRLTEEDRFTRELFGKRFMRAYLAVAGSER